MAGTSTAYPKQEKLFTVPFIILTTINFLCCVALNMISTILTSFLGTLGATVSLCGLAGGIFSFASLCFRPFNGYMVDALHRKRLASGSLVLMIIAMLITASTNSVILIIVCRVVHGICNGIVSNCCLVMLSEIVPMSRIGEGMGYYNTPAILAMSVGPVIGLRISNTFGYRANIYSIAGVLTLTLLLLVTLPYTYSAGSRKPFVFSLDTFIEKKVLLLAFISMCFISLLGGTMTFLVAYGQSLGIADVGGYYVVYAISTILCRIFMAKRADFWSLKKQILPAVVIDLAAVFLLGTAKGLTVILIVSFMIAFAQGMYQPLLSAESLRRVPAERRGVVSSTMAIGGDIGLAGGGMIGGVIAQHIGYGPMFMCFAVPLVFAAAAFFLYEKMKASEK